MGRKESNKKKNMIGNVASSYQVNLAIERISSDKASNLPKRVVRFILLK